MATKGHLLYYPEGKHDILLGKELNDVLKSKVNSVTKITYQDLKDLRDNSKLTPGALYRITDYKCTTTQENTRSAGHQFDIVLLALSADKLAEEGWAMMHDSIDMFDDYDIYTITFNDGVSKQCYYKVISNPPNDSEHRIVDTETFLGFRLWHNPAQDGFVINTENKTATNAYISSTEFESYLQTQYSYNYFQNSNLSAWKVWYCLDNDKSRFAWAEKDVPTFTCNINVPSGSWSFENVRVIRDYGADYDGRYAYVVINGDTVTNIATDRELKDSGDYTIYLSVHLSANAHVEILSSSVTRNGRGVIYRLIDEWNNDCPYDFKNIQFKRWAITALTTGSEDMKAALIYDADDNPFCFGAKDVYNGDAISGATFSTEISEFYFTFNAVDEGVNKDYSLGDWGVDDENGKAGAYLNVISPFYRDVNGEIGSAPIVLNNVVFINAFDGDYWYNCSLNKFGGNCQTLTFGSSCWQNTFGNYFQSNTFGNNCGRNTFGNECYGNTFGNDCYNNTFGNGCYNNTFGNNCQSNTFGNNCNFNTFGNNCYNNTFGNSCNSNTFGNNFIGKTISDDTIYKNYGNNGVELATKS